MTIRQALAFAAALAIAAPAAAQTPRPDGAHDFDFEFGAWKTHLKRRLHPLTGSNEWADYDGTSVVRKVWNGAANLGELELAGPAGRIEGLSLRIYDPKTHEWRISYANSAIGDIGTPMVGGFRSGPGEFYDRDTLNGHAIFVRFVFSDITPRTFRLEQAFSEDGGKSWEANWIATFEKTG
jgi:hypothetical protein